MNLSSARKGATCHYCKQYLYNGSVKPRGPEGLPTCRKTWCQVEAMKPRHQA